ETEAFDKEVARSEVSDLIDSLMKKEGVKKAELAKRLGKSRAYVTKILQGNANFTLDTLVLIARALGYKFAPVFLPKAEWDSTVEVHLSTKPIRTKPKEKLANDDYIAGPLHAEGGDDEESGGRVVG